MVFKFDPVYWNGTIFELDEDTWKMSPGWMEYRPRNEPIPASYFPKSVIFGAAKAVLPDMFHTARNIIIFSERARVVTERWAPGQVEFIPVTFRADPKTAARLNFDSCYYFINVLGRAQRLQWLEMPVERFSTRDGIELLGSLHDFKTWKLRERSVEEPLIWHDTPWVVGNKRYVGHTDIFVEDILWRELDANFPDQLNDLHVGK